MPWARRRLASVPTLWRSAILAAIASGSLTAPATMAADGGIPLEPGRIVADQPVGLFCSVQVTTVGSRRVDTRTWLFLPGHRVSRVYPHGGTGLFDPSRCSGDTCGSYQLEQAQLSVRWDGGRVDRWTFASSDEGISLDGKLFRPALALTVASLVGQWSDAGESDGNLYAFADDGRFSFGTRERALGGTYVVEGLTLTLRFADGDVRRRTLFALSRAQPAMISIESDVYKRK